MNERPRHRIHAVQAMTGVPAATLRTWERRYKIPEPARNADNAYRLYSDDDVARIRQMSSLCGQGVAPREAARQLRLAASDSKGAQTLVDQLIAAAGSGDRSQFESALASVRGWGRAIEVFDELLQPVLQHIESEAPGVRRAVRLRLATWLRDSNALCQPDPSYRSVLIASVHDDDLVAMEAALRVAPLGWRSNYIGRRTPPTAVEAALRLEPAAVVLSADLGVLAELQAYDLALPCAVLIPHGDAPELPGDFARLEATEDLPAWLLQAVGEPQKTQG